MQKLEIKNISFSYYKKDIFDNISITLNPGDIIGLIGPNGSGKSTLLKIIINKFKNDYKINYLIDKPVFYPYLTGYDNLKALSYIIKDKCYINYALKIVGLKNCNIKYKNYSLGMKQKLGIAKCICTDADIYLFDEPINGLDVEGIIMFRNIIYELKRKNKIVIISSHLLNELNIMINKLMLIKNKDIITVNNIKKNNLYTFKVSSIPNKYKNHVIDNNTFKYIVSKNNLNDIIHDLLKSNIKIYEIIRDSIVEDIYLKELSC